MNVFNLFVVCQTEDFWSMLQVLSQIKKINEKKKLIKNDMYLNQVESCV